MYVPVILIRLHDETIANTTRHHHRPRVIYNNNLESARRGISYNNAMESRAVADAVKDGRSCLERAIAKRQKQLVAMRIDRRVPSTSRGSNSSKSSSVSLLVLRRA